MENPFISYWLWYYDVLWRYWSIVVLLAIIYVWLTFRRYAKWQRERDDRKETESSKRQVNENDIEL